MKLAEICPSLLVKDSHRKGPPHTHTPLQVSHILRFLLKPLLGDDSMLYYQFKKFKETFWVATETSFLRSYLWKWKRSLNAGVRGKCDPTRCFDWILRCLLWCVFQVSWFRLETALALVVLPLPGFDHQVFCIIVGRIQCVLEEDGRNYLSTKKKIFRSSQLPAEWWWWWWWWCVRVLCARVLCAPVLCRGVFGGHVLAAVLLRLCFLWWYGCCGDAVCDGGAFCSGIFLEMVLLVVAFLWWSFNTLKLRSFDQHTKAYSKLTLDLKSPSCPFTYWLSTVSPVVRIEICSDTKKEHNYAQVKPASSVNHVFKGSAHQSRPNLNHVMILERNLHKGAVAVSDVALFDVALRRFHQWWPAISAKICGTVSQRRSRLLYRHGHW